MKQERTPTMTELIEEQIKQAEEILESARSSEWEEEAHRGLCDYCERLLQIIQNQEMRAKAMMGHMAQLDRTVRELCGERGAK